MRWMGWRDSIKKAWKEHQAKIDSRYNFGKDNSFDTRSINELPKCAISKSTLGQGMELNKLEVIVTSKSATESVGFATKIYDKLTGDVPK